MLLNCGVGEDSWKSLGLQGVQTSQSYTKSILNIHGKEWCWISNTLTAYAKSWLIRKDPDAGKIEGRRRGWQRMRWLDGITDSMSPLWGGHEFEQTLGDGEGQDNLACCSPWGRKELDMTECLNWTELKGRLKKEREIGEVKQTS